jgi:hypothetical protein
MSSQKANKFNISVLTVFDNVVKVLLNLVTEVPLKAILPGPSTIAVGLNLGVTTQNWVAGNVPMGREYFIKITLFFILEEPFDKSESVWKRK